MTPSVAPSPITDAGWVCSGFFDMETTSIQAREQAVETRGFYEPDS
jgi:hypothetical protein